MSFLRNLCVKLISNKNGKLEKIPKYTNFCRNYSNGSNNMKVAVMGAAGKTGQAVSLMLKQSNFIDELAIMDVIGTCGVGLELGHVDTKCKVYAYTGYSNIQECLQNAKIVVIVASAPKSSSLPHSEMFEPNSGLIKEIAEICAEFAPKALFAIGTDPINTTVPLFSEVLKKEGKYNPHAIFGVTALDVVRANTYVAEILGLDPECVIVPIIGGSSEKTIVPVLSQTKPYPDFKIDELESLTKQIKQAGPNLMKVKTNESAYLSGAFAISRFIISLVKGLRGQGNIVECAYVRSAEHPHASYLSTPLQLGPQGIQRNMGIPQLTEYEQCLLEKAIRQIRDDVRKAEMFMGIQSAGKCEPCDPNDPNCPPDRCIPPTVFS